MTIGEKIKKFRNEKAMTQSELAGGFITRNMLSLIESDAAQPSLPTILYLAERLNVPVGVIVEDEKYEAFYRRASVINNIRKAYSDGNYRICVELCDKTDADAEDNELNLIRAESYLGIAKEDFSEGNLKSSCNSFDMACEYATKTYYNTCHVLAEANCYCNYMRDISPSLFADCAEAEVYREMAFSDEFCRYTDIIEKIDAGTVTELSEIKFRDSVYSSLAQAKLTLKRGDYGEAYELMMAILNLDASVPSPIIYDIFKDLEVCCREKGDFKGAYEYSGSKVVMLERLLSDERF